MKRTTLVALIVGFGVMCSSSVTFSQSMSQEEREHRFLVHLADQGDADAQLLVSDNYEKGLGTAKNPTKSLQYLFMAASQGQPLAQSILGGKYWEGDGVPMDRVLSYAWLNLAVAGGDSRAASMLQSLDGYLSVEEIREAQRLSRSFRPQSPGVPYDSLKNRSKPSEGSTTSPQMVFSAVSKSIVVIKAADHSGREVAQGSGVVIDTDLVVTNCHVLESASSFFVKTGSKTVESMLVIEDQKMDVCFLIAPVLLAPSARIGSSRSLDVGSRVYAIGSPKGLEMSLSEGIVSQLRGNPSAPLIQTTAPISPGSSGGGLFDADGNLVGITTFYVDGGQNLNFALSIESVLRAYRSNGES